MKKIKVKSMRVGQVIKLGGRTESYWDISIAHFQGLEMHYEDDLIMMQFKGETLFVPVQGNVAHFSPVIETEVAAVAEVAEVQGDHTLEQRAKRRPSAKEVAQAISAS